MWSINNRKINNSKLYFKIISHLFQCSLLPALGQSTDVNVRTKIIKIILFFNDVRINSIKHANMQKYSKFERHKPPVVNTDPL